MQLFPKLHLPDPNRPESESYYTCINSDHFPVPAGRSSEHYPENGSGYYAQTGERSTKRAEMPDRVPQKTTIPILCALPKRDLNDGMPAGVLGGRLWDIPYIISGGFQPLAKVNVLKPDREKSFVKPSNRGPSIPSKHEKSPGRLFSLGHLIQVDAQATVVPIHPICGPEAVHAENFEGESGRSG